MLEEDKITKQINLREKREAKKTQSFKNIYFYLKGELVCDFVLCS